MRLSRAWWPARPWRHAATATLRATSGRSPRRLEADGSMDLPTAAAAPAEPGDDRGMRALEWISAAVAILVAILLNGVR